MRIDQKVMHSNFFLHWHCAWDVEISLGYSLKFSLQTQCAFFFMGISSERSVNYATKMTCMLLSSACEEQQSIGLVRFLWAEVHNPSEVHRNTCGMYGEDCMDHNIPRWCEFFKECALPGDIATVHTVFHVHATHVPVNFTQVIPFSPQKLH